MYKKKYIKYKTKYLTLKKQKGGSNEPHKIDINIETEYKRTIGSCVKELIDESYSLYSDLLKEGEATIICGGQSPAYYCLAMMNFNIYNPNLVDIIILPHSKGGNKSKNSDQFEENRLYCERLKDKDIKLKEKVIIIDGVHTGVGILALESALKYCFSSTTIKKYAINTDDFISEIPVDKLITLKCEPIFSDVFPRLVKSYYPKDFNDGSKFITEFKLDDNSIAQMIIDISRSYPMIKVQDTKWYQLNNVETEEISKVERERKEKEEKLKIQKDNRGKKFKPIILKNEDGKVIYQCPECKSKSGTEAVLYPNNTDLFSHDFFCPNKYKILEE